MFKLNMDGNAEERLHAKSPNRIARGMNINNDIGRKLYNININLNLNLDNNNGLSPINNQAGNVRKIPLPFNIKRRDSNNYVSSSNNSTANVTGGKTKYTVEWDPSQPWRTEAKTVTSRPAPRNWFRKV